MIRVAIVEDEKQAADRLEENLDRFAQTNGMDKFYTVRFDNAVKFLTGYKPVYDIVFMDIDMAGMNGYDASVKLRKIDPDVVLIFVTNLSQYAVKGYEVDALDFIVKPVSYYVLDLKLRRAMERIKREKDGEVSVSYGDSIARIKLSEIKYVEVLAHKLVYHTTRGDYKAYGTLKKAEDAVFAAGGGTRFVRCNSCYLVNLVHVNGLKGYTVTVGGDELGISRAKHKEFVQAVNNYMGR